MESEPGPSQTKTSDEPLRICKRLVKRLKEEKLVSNFILSLEDSEKRAERYTGLHPRVIAMLLEYRGYYKVRELHEVDRSVIHRELTNFYLQDRILPTTRQLYLRLDDQLPPYMDIGMFRKLLMQMEYIWKKLSNDSFVIMERPIVTFERHQYLKQISRYRKEGRVIYFVDECYFDGNGNYSSFSEMMYEESNPCISRLIYAVSNSEIHFIKELDKFNATTFMEWLLEEVIPSAPPMAVFVINNASHHCKEALPTPTTESLKCEMKKWLHFNNVPFERCMSRQELYSLIENYTHSEEKLYKIESVMKVNDFAVLRIPNSIVKLTPTTLVCLLIKRNSHHLPQLMTSQLMSPFAAINAMLSSVEAEQLQKYDKYIATEEEKLFETSLKVDEVLDDLCDSTSRLDYNKENEDSDLPESSDEE